MKFIVEWKRCETDWLGLVLQKESKPIIFKSRRLAEKTAQEEIDEYSGPCLDARVIPVNANTLFLVDNDFVKYSKTKIPRERR